MIMWLFYLPLLLGVSGIVYTALQIFKQCKDAMIPISERDVKVLETDIDTIKRVSRKYKMRIRGSVRLCEGRIKSVDDIRAKEASIVFP